MMMAMGQREGETQAISTPRPAVIELAAGHQPGVGEMDPRLCRIAAIAVALKCVDAKACVFGRERHGDVRSDAEPVGRGATAGAKAQQQPQADWSRISSMTLAQCGNAVVASKLVGSSSVPVDGGAGVSAPAAIKSFTLAA